jgi:hypothetical protein
MDGACNKHGSDEKYIKSLVEKPETKRPLRRLRGKWEDDIRIDVIEIRWEGVDWIYLAQNRDKWWALCTR